MQTKSRLPLIAYASSIMLPYGTVIADTPLMMTNQFWLFPLWTLLLGFNNWQVYGVIIPPFLPWFSLILPIMGLFWCVLGLYVSKELHQFYDGLRDAKLVWVLTIRMLIIQSIVTIIIEFIDWGYWLLLVVPLPLHFLIVLFLLRIRIQRVQQEEGRFI